MIELTTLDLVLLTLSAVTSVCLALLTTPRPIKIKIIDKD